MTQQNMPPSPNGKKLYVVNLKSHHTMDRNYTRILAESEEEAVEIAEKTFWRETQGWGVKKLELNYVRPQNDS